MSEKIHKKIVEVDYFLSSTNGEVIDFVEKTKGFGRAEFVLCPIWMNGSIVKVFLFPSQQPNAKYYYVFNPKEHSWEGIFFGTYINHDKGELSQPSVWKTFWCKDHECQAFRMYVPVGSSRLKISTGLMKFNMEWE